MTSLKVGDIAPEFNSVNQAGAAISLNQFKGKKVALYFYPKDNTPTCTKQACNLRDNYKELQGKGIEILGVSPDGEKSHTKFIEKFELPFSLIVDSDLSIAKAYEVYGPKKFMGRETVGIHRTTFIINEEGKIEDVIRKVKSKEHHLQILGQ